MTTTYVVHYRIWDLVMRDLLFTTPLVIAAVIVFMLASWRGMKAGLLLSAVLSVLLLGVWVWPGVYTALKFGASLPILFRLMMFQMGLLVLFWILCAIGLETGSRLHRRRTKISASSGAF